MFGFFKKMLGLPTEEEKAAASAAPYKLETPVPAQDVAPQPAIIEGAGAVEIPVKPKKAATPKKAPEAKKATDTKPAKSRGRKPKAK